MPKSNKPTWFSKTYDPDDTQRDSVSGEFFKNTRLESVVREAIQNSLDARPKGSTTPASVRIYYSGNGAAIDGNVYAAQFRGEMIDSHYAHKKSGLEGVPSASEKCVFLTIEDFNTTGLTGDLEVRVYINDEQYFDNVSETAWNFFIGGYQPAQKWLKDRKTRTHTADDILHYKSIIIALMETSRLMSDLSAMADESMAQSLNHNETMLAEKDAQTLSN